MDFDLEDLDQEKLRQLADHLQMREALSRFTARQAAMGHGEEGFLPVTPAPRARRS